MAAFIEKDFAINQGKKSPIAACADVLACNEFGASLANDDAAGADEFTAEAFYSEPLAIAVTSIAAAALTFFMSHIA